MASRRGTDGFSLPSVEGNDKTNFLVPNVNNLPRNNNLGARDESDHSTGASEPARDSRREDNPFSFKHFLREEKRPSYSVAGARPKVYPPSRTSPRDEHSDKDGIYPCNPTELPDFVQDHLVVEQCYASQETAPSACGGISVSGLAQLVESENLPDFAIIGSERRQTRRSSARKDCQGSEIPGDLPFDLTGGLEKINIPQGIASSSDSASDNSSNYQRPNQLPLRRTKVSRGLQAPFPFDLPSTIGGSSTSESTGNANSPASEQPTGVNKLLPDFLNDGPIRRATGNNAGEIAPADITENSDASLLSENEWLREELKMARRQIADRARMIESLKKELASRRALDHDEAANLEKAMEQVECNLKRSTKRATSAESAVTLLKQEIKALTAEVSTLRSENRELRSIAGASCPDYRFPGTENKIKKLSDDLRAAATSAEISLRQLMSGVSNLKVMASALENIDRIEDRTKDFLPDFDEENTAGPAL